MAFFGFRSKRFRAAVLPLVVGGFLPLATAGCFGRFALTQKVYEFNREVDSSKWIQWLAFLVLNVVPVYPFAVVIDAVFANSVEFWTGANPVVGTAAGGETKVVRGPAGEVVRMTRLAPGVVDVSVAAPDGTVQQLTLVLEREALAAYDHDGTLVARVGDRDGAPALIGGRLAAR